MFVAFLDSSQHHFVSPLLLLLQVESSSKPVLLLVVQALESEHRMRLWAEKHTKQSGVSHKAKSFPGAYLGHDLDRL
jgi:hypothetical protein